MKVNNGLKLTAATAMALVIITGVKSIDASAAAIITPKDIKTSGKDQKVYIDVQDMKNTNEEVMFGMATKGKKSDDITFRVSAWDIFEVGNNDKIAVDLSKLSNIKDNFVAIKTDAMDVPIIIRIPAVPKIVTAEYDAAEQILKFKTGTSRTSLEPAKGYEWRTPYSNWNSSSDSEKLSDDGETKKVFDEFKYQGATLYIRTPGAAEAGITETTDDDLKNKKTCDASSGKEVTVYDAGSFPGREAKLNIAKQANGPSVAAKYTSGTLTLPASSEYRVVTIVNGVKTIPDKPTDNDSRVSVSIKDLLTKSSTGSSIAAEEGILEVRTKENTTGRKPKAASKWTRVFLSNSNDLEVTGADGDILNATVKDSDNNTILKITKDDNNDISVENLTEDSYQIVVMQGTKVPEVDAKYTRLNKKSTITIKNESGQTVYIRKSGDSRTKTWVSDYVKIGTIN